MNLRYYRISLGLAIAFVIVLIISLKVLKNAKKHISTSIAIILNHHKPSTGENHSAMLYV